MPVSPARAREICADPDERALLDCAEAAARAAGAHALAHSGRRGQVVRAFAHDVKLRLDRECQDRVEAIIRRRFPNHAILGEESETPAGPDTQSETVWVVDPIDGTVNFFHGLPWWCCSVAVQHNGRTLAGAVVAPALGECFTARAHGPACRNGRPIRVSTTARPADALVLTGVDKRRSRAGDSFRMFAALAAATQKARVLGAAALDLCRVACGEADAYYEGGIYLWDVAAGGLIVERAGGRAEILPGAPGPDRLRFLATNGRLHAAFRRLLSDRR
jgi:myo-inositol-1(or 4)-monophosphatase